MGKGDGPVLLQLLAQLQIDNSIGNTGEITVMVSIGVLHLHRARSLECQARNYFGVRTEMQPEYRRRCGQTTSSWSTRSCTISEHRKGQDTDPEHFDPEYSASQPAATFGPLPETTSVCIVRSRPVKGT